MVDEDKASNTCYEFIKTFREFINWPRNLNLIYTIGVSESGKGIHELTLCKINIIIINIMLLT